MSDVICKHCIYDDGVCDQEMCSNTSCEYYEPVEEE
jgi:hypothetical protein